MFIVSFSLVFFRQQKKQPVKNTDCSYKNTTNSPLVYLIGREKSRNFGKIIFKVPLCLMVVDFMEFFCVQKYVYTIGSQ